MVSAYSHHLVTASIYFYGIDLQLMASFFVYGSNNRDRMRTFWNNIVQSLRTIHIPVIVIGDFNVVGEATEKVGGNMDISKSIEELQGFISDSNLIELPFKGISYTWTNNRDELCHIRERIDRVLVSSEWMEFYPLCLLTHEPLIGSDHTPLLLNTEPSQPRSKKFRFETMWTRSDQCEDLLKQNWKQDSDSNSTDIVMTNPVYAALV